MDHTRDNPLKRFTAFWVALLLVTAFGIACIILRPITHARVDSAMEAAAEDRRALRAEVDNAQDKNLNQDALDEAFQASAASLIASKPTPGKVAVPKPATKAPAEPEPASE